MHCICKINLQICFWCWNFFGIFFWNFFFFWNFWRIFWNFFLQNFFFENLKKKKKFLKDMRLREMMKCWASSPCLNCVGWQDMSLTEDRASSPCLDCIGWQDMRVVSGRASSPCLNCMGWQDTSLTVAKEDRASSPYLNCIGWQDKSSSRWSFPMSGGMASSLRAGQADCRSEEPQCSVNCIYTIRMLPNWPHSRTASSWSLGW